MKNVSEEVFKKVHTHTNNANHQPLYIYVHVHVHVPCTIHCTTIYAIIIIIAKLLLQEIDKIDR